MKLPLLLAFAALSTSVQAQTNDKLFVSWGSKDVHYAATERPNQKLTTDTVLQAWRGERAAMQAIIYAPKTVGKLRVRLTELKSGRNTLAANSAQARFVNYVTTDNYQYCGYHPATLTPYQVPDVIDLDVAQQVDEGTAHPVWCTIEVPQTAAPGSYATQLEVVDDATQKVVSAILFYEPWGDQSNDKFDAMIKTTKGRDGQWHYDYTVFDRWVALCAECGIDEQINCFSMVPWDMTFRYYDEATGKDVDLKTTTSSKEYKELWSNFLKSFATHLKQKGWFDKTCIAMDERGLDNMLDAYRVAQEAVPGIKMALAGTYHPELLDKLYDYCIGFGEAFTANELAARKAKGYKSTTYTCCSNTEPNLFSNSLSAEAAYIPVWCTANGFEGYLHWSWMNWTDSPLSDTRFRLFAPGDTYLIYPGPRSSVRYERFIEGIALAEKVRLLREEYQRTNNTAALNQLNEMVSAFQPAGIPQGRTAAEMVNALQQLVNK